MAMDGKLRRSFLSDRLELRIDTAPLPHER